MSTFVAWYSSDIPELITQLVCLAGLTGLAWWLGGGRWLVVLVVPIPAFVLLHERLEVRHWVAYGPAALSLATAIWADRAWRRET